VSPGLTAERDVYELESYDPVAVFFDGMESCWRGWADERGHSSHEGDLDIVAVHDGHVRLAIRLNQWSGPSKLRAYVDVVLDAGEHLVAASAQMRSLVSGQ